MLPESEDNSVRKLLSEILRSVEWFKKEVGDLFLYHLLERKKGSSLPLSIRENTSCLPTQLDIFDRELSVRWENIFGRRGAACGQGVTTFKIYFCRDDLKSEETRDRRQPLASSLLSDCLACHAVLVSNIFSRRRSRVRATLYDIKTSFQGVEHRSNGRRETARQKWSHFGTRRRWRRRPLERCPL